MAPWIAFSPSVVAWLLATSVGFRVSTARSAGGASTMSRLSAESRPEDLRASSENTGNDSFECGSGCFEGENDDHEEGLDHDTRSSGEAVDLGELADRVNDALVAKDTDSTSSPPPPSPPSCSGEETTGKIGTRCEHVEHGCVFKRSVANEQGAALAPKAEESEAATHQAADGTKVSPPSTGEMCGEGELHKTCSPGEECCNSSCGICAPKGQSCLRIACGALKSEGGSKSTTDGTTSASRQVRLRRQSALVSSISQDESLSPKDRLRDLQLHAPELFEHVSVKGLKRLIAQSTHKAGRAQELPSDKLKLSPASPDRPVSQPTIDKGGNKAGARKPGRDTSQALPQKVKGGSHARDSSHSTSESLKRNDDVQGRQQRQAEKVKATSRAPSSTRARSTLDKRRKGEEGGSATTKVVSPGEGGNTATHNKTKGRTNEAAPRPQQQDHRGVEDPGRNKHPRPATKARHPRPVDESSASSSTKSSGFSFENPSVWDVGHSLTGLADIDVTSTMNGLLERVISEEMREESDRLGRERAAVLRAAMGLLWKGYSDHAWGYDEVKPLGKSGNNNWGGMGVTLVDSLDTLWLMGLSEEFYNGRDWVRDHMTFNNAGLVSVFETTIRVLGGLLSAFELSRDRVFLDRAKELADKLLPAFATSTGIPYKMVNLSTGTVGGGTSSVLSELGTLQLEFRYLSRELGEDKYAEKAMRAFDFLAEKSVVNGLYPIKINPNTGMFTSTHVSLGALGDSFYEYLLKVWMQGGRSEDNYRRMYDEAMDGVDELLVQKARGLTYLSEWDESSRKPQHRMDHLACFMAGNLALGSLTSRDPARAARDLKTGKALAYTCYQMYLLTATGLSPETVEFTGSGSMKARPKARYYVLRPETLESFFVLHQLTGDPVYREWGWEIFRAIERHCRVGVGYGSHPDVENPSRGAKDHMESFFPGETLKYMYLLMQPDHPIDLMEYTFNTEAHPLKIFPFDGGGGGVSGGERDGEVLS